MSHWLHGVLLSMAVLQPVSAEPGGGVLMTQLDGAGPMGRDGGPPGAGAPAGAPALQ